MADKPVLVHYHIFKNAGCSVDASLKASFGGAWVEFEGAHAHDVQSSIQLAAFLRGHQNVRAVSSHLARPPLPWAGCLPVVFLRHPVLRARSVYEFTRRDSTQPFSHVARDRGFADYVRWALRRERGSIVVRNYQVVHLSQASWRTRDILDAEACEGDLEESCELLSDWGVAGIVETYARSIRVLQAIHGKVLPELVFKNVRINASTQTCALVAEQVEDCREALGMRLYEEFMAANALDMALYNQAARLLDHAAQAVSID